MKKILSLALGCMMSLSLLTACTGGEEVGPSPSANQDAEQNEAPKKLVFGTSADYPPYEFHILENGEDKIVGFDVALAHKIAEDMGAELEIVDMSFDNLLTMMAQGKCDFVIADMESTPDREKAADSSDPYYEDLPPMVLVKKANLDQYKTIEDFSGKKVGAQTGTNKALIVTGEDEETAPIHMTGTTPVLLANAGDLINQLVYDKCDAVVLDGAVAMKYVESNPDLAVVEDVELGSVGLPCVWVAEGDPKALLDSINQTIADLKANDTFKTYMEEADALSSQAMG